MRIAVIGASGNTGSAVAQLALENGHDLRAVVRNPDSCANLAAHGAEIVIGDLDDHKGVFSALTGVALIETKRAIEGDLAASSLAHTILRPSMFMDNVAMAGPGTLLGRKH